MATTRSANEIWLVGNPKSDLNTSCLPTDVDVLRYFFPISKNQNASANDVVKQKIEAVIEISFEIGNFYEKLLAAFETTSKNF